MARTKKTAQQSTAPKRGLVVRRESLIDWPEKYHVICVLDVGTVVTVRKTVGDWSEVSFGLVDGWFPASALEVQA